MEDTLEKAIDKIFARSPILKLDDAPVGQGAGPAIPLTTGTESGAALAALAQQHFEAALKAQREGNWAVYGDEIKKVGELLGQMTRGQAPAPDIKK
jgi:uncharacterized membrane protein (UPF0182 family)